METSLKAGFAQIFSCCRKNLSCPKFGGAAASLTPPGQHAYALILIKHYGSFILKLFLPLTFTVFLRIQNTFRKIKVV